MKLAFLSGVLVASLVPFAAPQKPALTTTLAPECENLIPHEPMLLYEVAGTTLTGPVDLTLTVFADGQVKISSTTAGGRGKCASGQIRTDDAGKLYQQLANAGALTLCDEARLVTDVPLHTLTMLSGAQNMRGRTFSYWLGDGQYANVDAVMEQFILLQFPEF